jgi:hypothetical protein
MDFAERDGPLFATAAWLMGQLRDTRLIPAPEQHESAYLLPENAVDGGVVFGI